MVLAQMCAVYSSYKDHLPIDKKIEQLPSTLITEKSDEPARSQERVPRIMNYVLAQMSSNMDQETS